MCNVVCCVACFGHGSVVFCMIEVRVVHVRCMCGVLLVWVGVSWDVFVVGVCCVVVYVGCMSCACSGCVAWLVYAWCVALCVCGGVVL